MIFDLKKTREKKILDMFIENLPEDNGKCCIEHKTGINSFQIRQDKNQREKTSFWAYS